jgi:rhodanese-related sulfurtransferase
MFSQLSQLKTPHKRIKAYGRGMETRVSHPEITNQPMPLTKEEVLEKMKDPSVVLVNVLPQEQFDRLHIQGSQNLALGPNVRTFESAAAKRFTKQTHFITYGADENGTLGQNAAKLLTVHGYKADYYPGGLKDWSRAGWPTSRTKQSASSPAPAPLKRKEKK